MTAINGGKKLSLNGHLPSLRTGLLFSDVMSQNPHRAPQGMNN